MLRRSCRECLDIKLVVRSVLELSRLFGECVDVTSDARLLC